LTGFNKNVLLTGSSGFLGTEILNHFVKNDFTITSLGRTFTDAIQNKINWNLEHSLNSLPDLNYVKVIHIAGKAHIVPKTTEEEEAFYTINYKATKELLSKLKLLTELPKQLIFISTVAVYGIETGENISETKEPNPKTPYGKSKYLAEKEVIKWCTLNKVNYLILRLPLIVGINPPGNLNKMLSAISKGTYPQIFNNTAKKSAVLAEDIAVLTTKNINVSGIYNLTDGVHPSFNEFENAFAKSINKKIFLIVPVFILRVVARFGSFFEYVFKKSFPFNITKLNKLILPLTFNDEKARKELDWKSNPVIPFIESKKYEHV